MDGAKLITDTIDYSKVGALGLTEPDTGSDARSIRATTVVKSC